jgi:hypothetical protein
LTCIQLASLATGRTYLIIGDRLRPALISGMTGSTSGSIRKADELSMTTAPAGTATGGSTPSTGEAGAGVGDHDPPQRFSGKTANSARKARIRVNAVESAVIVTQ